jgi:hypothetical protein
LTDFIENPRRTPRAAVALVARASLTSGRAWNSPTVDLGPGGCQLVAPVPCDEGQRIFLELRGAALPEPKWLSGDIAWVDTGPERRIGVEFDASSRPAAANVFERLSGSSPHLLIGARAPRNIPLAARVTSGVRPDSGVLRPREAELVRAVGAGLSIGDLRDRLGDRWDLLVNPLFSLLDRNHLILGTVNERH